MLVLVFNIGLGILAGCTHQQRPATPTVAPLPPVVVAVAPVLNLSNSTAWDPVKVTDIVASELQSFPNVVVIPVNRTLAALALMGRNAVETPEDALELAAELGAEATLVTAITEYDPYDPPRIGIVMQWYARGHQRTASGFDPVGASRQATEVRVAADGGDAPVLQVQQVYSAADNAVLRDVRRFAAARDGHDSAYRWRVHIKSQQLFTRYCCWASIRTIWGHRESRVTAEPDETTAWTQEEDA